MNDGYGNADEVSFAAMTTTSDFLGSLSSRDEKMDAYHGRTLNHALPIKLDKDNYMLWRTPMENVIYANSFEDHVEVGFTPEIMGQIIGYQTSHEAWFALEKTFSTSSKARVTKKVILKGHLERGLYKFPTSFSFSTDCLFSSFNNSSSSNSTTELWHSRLGHPAEDILKHALNNCKLQICYACQYAKNHKLPFLLSMSRASHLLALVHADI
ncbi:hypothetical protein CK203_076696 [Vitis vinifera]|uniref:GAG-pre-integrase domain-containing protein n=1 Tax=Vitis vinifera TaxID=29760 RepID=A0A438EPK2_VITVI|nr:hypothetical protein CK203_076696 [Vitis vinifera]